MSSLFPHLGIAQPLPHRPPPLFHAREDFGLESFGGHLPVVGDLILDPRSDSELNRKNRRIWNVVQRVFNPRDNADYIALVVEEQPPTGAEEAVL